MDPRKILKVAEKLRETDEAAFYRSSVSRAYYAAFNVALELLEKMKIERDKQRRHAKDHLKFAVSEDEIMKEVGDDLGKLHLKRIAADYKMMDASIQVRDEADAAIILARQLIEQLTTCKNEPARLENVRLSIVKNYKD